MSSKLVRRAPGEKQFEPVRNIDGEIIYFYDNESARTYAQQVGTLTGEYLVYWVDGNPPVPYLERVTPTEA